jgi:hypothetical protein
VLEEFGNAIARGGAGVVIASQSGHRLPPLTVEQNKALATTPVEELLSLPFLQPDQVTDSRTKSRSAGIQWQPELPAYIARALGQETATPTPR